MTEELKKTSTPVYKKCHRCHEYKTLDLFHLDKSRGDGHRYNCKVCSLLERWRYVSSPGGHATTAKYHLSGRYKLYQQCYYDKHGGENVYRKELYHRHQDEMVYHGDPRVFYPAYRFLVALQEAEVIEI